MPAEPGELGRDSAREHDLGQRLQQHDDHERCQSDHSSLPAPLGPRPRCLQYILKPPGAACSAFQWHRDSDWCRSGEAHYHPYISGKRAAAVSRRLVKQLVQQELCGRQASSRAEPGVPSRHSLVCAGLHLIATPHVHAPTAAVWVALDDMSAGNGCLTLKPGSHLQAANCRRETAPAAGGAAGAQEEGQQQQQQHQELALEVAAGTAIITSDTVLHCSGPNRSAHMRRAWMPQFSAAPLRWRAGGNCVSLAIPLQQPAS